MDTLQSTLPVALTASSVRVAAPPVVAAGLTIVTYVPPLNGSMPVTRPSMLSVQAVAPVAVEIAVISEVGDVAPDAVVSVTARRLLPDRSTCREPEGSVAVNAVVPVDRMATTSNTRLLLVDEAASRVR